MRLIDADALFNEIKKDTEKAIEQDDKVGSFWLGYFAGSVLAQPTVQSEPKIGKWILGFNNKYMEKYYYCSCCGHRKYEEHKPLDYFCSNCGSKMRRENC